METRADGQQSGRLKLALLLGVVVAIRLPFLDQAIQGDDVYYLAGAQHAQIEPLHPNHVRYVFLGDEVDLRGHPHPPLNAWFLGALLALSGDIREAPFHAAYLVFSLTAAAAMWWLARRFSPHPLWASLLFVATPAFVINGTSLESDLPLVAFWLAGVALFAAGCLGWAAAALALAALAAYQAIFLTPILAAYCWLYRRRDRAAWAVTLVPPATLLAWQAFERLSTGALPAGVLTGYFQTYGFQALEQKARNAVMLAIHGGWLVFPAVLPGAALLAWRRRREPDTRFLLAWLGIFFAGAVAVFFAGSMRYLLPMAAPAALLASRLRVRWLAAAFGAQLALSLALAWVNYQHWDGYRQFARSIRAQVAGRRVWINGEWGLRYYLESDGGLALQRGQRLRPGDVVVSSRLAWPVEFSDPAVPLADIEIRPRLPLRLIGLEARSGYSTHARGFRPFDITMGAIDRVTAELIAERRPTLSWLPMNAPGGVRQLVAGVYKLEGERWRWTAREAVVLLKTPEKPARLRAEFVIPGAAPARRVRLLLEGREVAAANYSGPGSYRLESPAQEPRGTSATVTLEVDHTFSVPGDRRDLGVILTAIGFAAAPR